VRLLRGLLVSPYRRLERLRANAFLNRVTADIDALDGLALRLVLPGLAGALAIVVTAAMLWWLVHPWVALVVGVGTLVLPNVVFVLGQRAARRPARQAEAGIQALRSRLVDLVAAREDLLVYGQLAAKRAHVLNAVERQAQARGRLDAVERRTGFALDLMGGGVVACALGVGAGLAQAGEISPARAAIGVFAALALMETVAPIRRALTEIGRMAQAARRIVPQVAGASGGAAAPVAVPAEGAVLALRDLRYAVGPREMFAPVSLELRAGATVALTGPSGSGKSTVLLLAAGALEATGGAVARGDLAAVLVPQRHALIAGSIAENLRLAAPEASEEALWAALQACALADVVRDKGGLEARLGFRGAGLSGGEARRLVLARAVLTQPPLLLLDEPTEGLDRETARAVMAGLRRALPRAAILMAAHRAAEITVADAVIPVLPIPPMQD
jgi:ATP-binding cassette subfamily C protein CydC